ncbi:MAG: phosphoheptose isomerase [Gammaproteobacteria bacterium]|jgi:D-sedoheptulose 7-phosphate isomerase|nr:phosphoheptose isomerase [Gammaproteobacteria bacterium]
MADGSAAGHGIVGDRPPVFKNPRAEPANLCGSLGSLIARYRTEDSMDIPAPAQRPHDLDIEAFLRVEADEHRDAFEATIRELVRPFTHILNIWEGSIRRGGKLLLFGNGGSAADAQHIAAELVIRYKTDRPAIAAIALTTDTSALTACSNDFGFNDVFARQVEALARPGDVAVGFSTSGKSPNVLAGLREARKRAAQTTGFTGAGGGAMTELCDAILAVPSTVTARIQEMHISVAHMLCKALEIRLGHI